MFERAAGTLQCHGSTISKTILQLLEGEDDVSTQRTVVLVFAYLS